MSAHPLPGRRPAPAAAAPATSLTSDAPGLYHRTNELQLARQQAQDREALAARDLAETAAAAETASRILTRVLEAGCVTADECEQLLARLVVEIGASYETARLSYDQARQATATAHGFGGAWERQRAGFAQMSRPSKAA